MGVKDRYDEVFEVEIDGWCYGIANYPGEIEESLVFNVVRELTPSFEMALNSGFVFDILDVSLRLSKAAKYLVDERDIAWEILKVFPNPASLGEEAQFVLAQIVDKVEKEYSDAGFLEALEIKWATEKSRVAA